MQLVEQRDESLLLVRFVSGAAVMVGDRELRASFVLTPDRCLEDFPATSLQELDDAVIDEVLALDPALVLIGTGLRQHLPSPALMAGFLRHGIGLECMDSHAAARTYNLLASEGRKVAAIFLL